MIRPVFDAACKAMQELQAVIDNAARGVPSDISRAVTNSGKPMPRFKPATISGTILLRGLNKMDSVKLLDAVGGNKKHVSDLFNLADILARSPKNVGRVAQTFRCRTWFDVFRRLASASCRSGSDD